MIVDRIENAKLYYTLHKKFKMAFEFLNNIKIDDFLEEKFEIEGDDVFAIMNDYTTKNCEDAKLEAHVKYIDIQYMIEGSELIGYTPLEENHLPSKKYNSKTDIAFYDNTPLFYARITAGMFSILYPEDLHMPGIKINTPSTVKKIVVKIKI
jgi:YhcH/YjgK/YiaL family protein